jgi:hypothetical protein
MKWAALIKLVGCGRLAFDPQADARDDVNLMAIVHGGP